MSKPYISYNTCPGCDQLQAENATLKARVTTLEHEKEDLKARNQILRTRPDLPMTDEQKVIYKRLEARVEELEKDLALARGAMAAQDGREREAHQGASHHLRGVTVTQWSIGSPSHISAWGNE